MSASPRRHWQGDQRNHLNSGILARVRRVHVLVLALAALLAACGEDASDSTKASRVPSSLDELSLLVWTPDGLVVFDHLDVAEGRPVDTPELLREPLTHVRQLSGGRLVGIAGLTAASPHLAAPGRPGDLVVLDPAAPESTLTLGRATGWFPGFEGDSIWRVRQLTGGPPSLDAEASFEVEELRLDGEPRGDTVTMPAGWRPVAATRTGLAVEQPAPPGRPYPPGQAGKTRTGIGGVVRDLVEADPDGQVHREISPYTTVLLGGTRGVAAVASSDPNASDIRPTEVIDLATGRSVPAPPAEPELAYWVYPQPRTSTTDGAVVAHASGPRELHVEELATGERVTVTKALPPEAPATVSRQDAAWSEGVLLLTEVADGGVRVAVWAPGGGDLRRGSAILPGGSFALSLFTP